MPGKVERIPRPACPRRRLVTLVRPLGTRISAREAAEHARRPGKVWHHALSFLCWRATTGARFRRQQWLGSAQYARFKTAPIADDAPFRRAGTQEEGRRRGTTKHRIGPTGPAEKVAPACRKVAIPGSAHYVATATGHDATNAAHVEDPHREPSLWETPMARPRAKVHHQKPTPTTPVRRRRPRKRIKSQAHVGGPAEGAGGEGAQGNGRGRRCHGGGLLGGRGGG